MKSQKVKHSLIFAIGVLITVASGSMVQGATRLLYAWVSAPDVLANSNGMALANGSIISLVGSGDAVNDGFVTNGMGDIIFDETAGDDVIIGYTTVDGVFGPGTFLDNSHLFDNASISFFYLRVFDATFHPITGFVNYGVSPVVAPQTELLGQTFVQFGSVGTTNLAFFVTVPEPDTASFILIAFFLTLGARVSLKRRKVAGAVTATVTEDRMPDVF